MKAKAHILIVEDDQNLAFVIQDNLEKEGYIVTHAKDGVLAASVFDPQIHELCILDVMLPKMDGFACAEHIRKKNQNTPILFLSAKSMEADKLDGFRSGGDDYITKPFSFQELLHRIEVFLKRSLRAENPNNLPVQYGNIIFDYNNLFLTVAGNERSLTQKEADLLQHLLSKPNCLLKREDILNSLWGDDDYFIGRSLDVFISRLRKYLAKANKIKIINHHGVGFKLVVDE